MGLEDLANQTKKEKDQEQTKNIPEQELDKIKSSVMMDSMIEGSMYYLFGCLYTYYVLNGWEPIAPEDAVVELQSLKDVGDNDEDVKAFLENSDEKLHQFLNWYMYDSR